MAIITLFRNPFSDVYSQFHCKNNITIKKAAKIDLENSLIFVNGKESTPDHILAENDICQIRILPSGSTVDVVAGVLTGGLYTAADAITYGITGSHISEHFYRGLRDLLLPDVDVETTNERTSLKSIPQLKGAKNQSGLNKPVPLVLGKHLFTPYYCGQPYSSIDPTDGSDGENLYFHALYMIGYSNVLVSDIKIGELELAGNSLKTLNGTIPVDPTSVYADHGVELEIQQSEEVSLFPVKVIEEQLSIELKNVDGIQRKPVRFSANNPKTVELEVTLNGLIGYSTTGAKQNRTVQICAQWKPHGGDTWYDFPQFINSNSYSSGVSTFTRQKNSQMRFVSRKTFDYSEIIDVESGIVDIRIFRTNPAGTDGRTTDGAFWTAIRTTCFDRAASIDSSALIDQKPVDEELRNKTCRLGFKIKAGEDVEGTIDEINMIVESIARTWNGSSWTSMLTAISNVTTSNNTASVALLALEQPHLGKESVSPSKIDYDGFGALYEFCENKGYTCNGVLTTTQKEDDLIDKLLSTCRSQKITKDGKYSPLIDNERLYPITIINQQNTISCSNTKEFNVLPDGLRVTFIDEADGYQKNELRVLYDGKSVDDPDLVYEDLELPWVTNRDHAWKLGRYILAVKKLRPEVWNRKVGIDGRAIPIGSRVLVQDDTIAIGLHSGGEIKQILTSGDNISGIVSDSHFEMIDGQAYGIEITQADGTHEPTIRKIQLITTPGWTKTLMFAEEISPSEDVLPTEGDFFSFGEYSIITLDALVLGRTPSGDEEWELSLVEYNEDIYNADTGTIPDFDSKITKPIGPAKIPDVPQKVVTVSDVQESIGESIADRPTYTEIATGFTAAGLVIIPAQLNATAVGGFRFITITWAKQANLSNLKEYQIQCSENAINWYAPSLDGSGTNGHGTTENGYFSTTSPMLIHPNIPPAGTEEDPVGRLLYYRVRQLTALDAVSEWSTVVAATTKLADSGDYAANSISLNALKTSELYALFATLSETLIIDPNAGLASQSSDYTEGDSRTVLNARELLFQYVLSGEWVTIVRLALEGLMANQVYSKDKLFITNDDMAGRRSRGFDIGLAYLSENSRVCHYDTDLLDQTGATYWSLTGSGVLVGKDDGITPAIVAVAPYATEAKSLLGNFRLQKDIGITNVFTLDFWIRYYYNENQELFRVGSENEYVSIDILNSEPYYNEDDFQYNDEAISDLWYNEIQGAVARVVYYLNGAYDIRYIQDSQGNPGLVTNAWYHIGVIDFGTALVVLINSSRFEFESPNARTEAIEIDINPGLGQFLIDELFVDATIAETESAFIANTIAKKPWAKLSDTHDWFVLDVKDPDYVMTNIFESQVFQDAVLAIAAPKV